jgi:hypothetical protein
MSPTLYDHLLTCDTRSDLMDNMVNKLNDTWEKSHILNTPPILHGGSPSITLPQVAFLLASVDPFAEKFLRPDMLRLFRLALNEAKSSLVSHCRTNPTIDLIRNSANQATQYPIGAELTPDGDPIEENDLDEDGEDNHNEDRDVQF